MTYRKYENPSQLAANPDLSREKKISILEKWRQDEIALQRASSDGMSGGHAPKLKTIENALAILSDRNGDLSLSTVLDVADMPTLERQVEGVLGTNPS